MLFENNFISHTPELKKLEKTLSGSRFPPYALKAKP